MEKSNETQQLDYEYIEPTEKWWLEKEWIFPPEEDREPTCYEVVYSFIINKVVPCARCVELSGRFLPRTIVIESEHPIRGTEYARIIISPVDVADGAPTVEPDLIIHIRYYDLVRALDGEIDIMQPLFFGNGWLVGNTTTGFDLKDLVDVANGKKLVDRPKAWPIGHP